MKMEYSKYKLKMNCQMKRDTWLNADLNITWVLQLLSHSEAEVLKVEEKCAWDNSSKAMPKSNRNLNISNQKEWKKTQLEV